MIRIKVTDIPTRGLEVKDSISLAALNERMDEAPDNDIKFLDAPAFTITIKPEIAGAEVRGAISTKYSQPCGVCLTPLEKELHQEITITLKAKTTRPGIDRPTSSEEWEDDVGIIYFTGDHIDLEEILQETLILAVSPFESGHPDCPGLPKRIGAEEPERKATFGDLLKNVKIH